MRHYRGFSLAELPFDRQPALHVYVPKRHPGDEDKDAHETEDGSIERDGTESGNEHCSATHNSTQRVRHGAIDYQT